jgi:hypothetical protein
MDVSERAKQLGPALLVTMNAVRDVLRVGAKEACADPFDRYPFALAVLETLLASMIARVSNEDDLEDRIATSVAHVQTAREMFREKQG